MNTEIMTRNFQMEFAIIAEELRSSHRDACDVLDAIPDDGLVTRDEVRHLEEMKKHSAEAFRVVALVLLNADLVICIGESIDAAGMGLNMLTAPEQSGMVNRWIDEWIKDNPGYKKIPDRLALK